MFNAPAGAGFLVDVAFPTLRCERLSVREFSGEGPVEDGPRRIAVHVNLKVARLQVAFEKRLLQNLLSLLIGVYSRVAGAKKQHNRHARKKGLERVFHANILKQ